MALNQNQNKDIANYQIETLRLNPAYDTIPSEVNPSISPVLEISKREMNIVRVATTATTLYTTPSDKDFFLKVLHMNSAQLSTLGGTVNTLTITPQGGSATVISLVLATDASSSLSNSMTLNFPERGLKLARGSTIASAMGSDAASFLIVGCVSDSTPL